MKICQLYGKTNLLIKQQIEILISYGADIYLTNNAGEHPLDLCLPEVKQELLLGIHIQNPLKRRRTFEESFEMGLSVQDENQKEKRKRV